MLFDGFSAIQWHDIALQRDERQESPDSAFAIANALWALDEESTA